MQSVESGADVCDTEDTLRLCSNTIGSFDCSCPARTVPNEDNFCLLNGKYEIRKF